MGEMLLAVIPAAVILRGMCAGTDVYEAFTDGAKQGLRTGISLAPALAAMLLMLGMARASGLTDALCRCTAPLLRLAGLPEETAAVLLLRPLTGSGSMAALKEVYALCGPDSRAGRIASVLSCASETIFYTMTVYLGAAGIRRLPWAIPVSLAAYGAAAVTAGLIM